tara:strand:- start:3158 stop:3856 length:699 start_codon:yes stop_codon:yes gene_type:complete
MSELVNDDLASIESRLATLYSNNFSTHELSKFLYLRGLIDRANKKQHQPSASLIAKAYKALNQLELGLEEQRNEAQQQLAILEEDHEHVFEQATALCESKSYSELTRLFKSVRQKDSSQFFKDLINEIGGVELSAKPSTKSEQTLQSRANKIKQTELQSFKQYQNMFEKMALDRLLARVMKEIPENAGPLNPERLVIRSFKALQEISPDYLSSLISYYESLLTLQLVNTSDK